MDTIGVITASERAWVDQLGSGSGQTRHWPGTRAVLQCAHSGQCGRPHCVHCALGAVCCALVHTPGNYERSGASDACKMIFRQTSINKTISYILHIIDLKQSLGRKLRMSDLWLHGKYLISAF